jgi:hypothetical protein
MTKTKSEDPVEAGIRGLGAEPIAEAPHGGDLGLARAAQLASLRNDFMAKRLNLSVDPETGWTRGERVWDDYPDPAAAGFHPEIHPHVDIAPPQEPEAVKNDA